MNPTEQMAIPGNLSIDSILIVTAVFFFKLVLERLLEVQDGTNCSTIIVPIAKRPEIESSSYITPHIRYPCKKEPTECGHGELLEDGDDHEGDRDREEEVDAENQWCAKNFSTYHFATLSRSF